MFGMKSNALRCVLCEATFFEGLTATGRSEQRKRGTTKMWEKVKKSHQAILKGNKF
jgi:hypothetical protein